MMMMIIWSTNTHTEFTYHTDERVNICSDKKGPLKICTVIGHKTCTYISHSQCNVL